MRNSKYMRDGVLNLYYRLNGVILYFIHHLWMRGIFGCILSLGLFIEMNILLRKVRLKSLLKEKDLLLLSHLFIKYHHQGGRHLNLRSRILMLMCIVIIYPGWKLRHRLKQMHRKRRNQKKKLMPNLQSKLQRQKSKLRVSI